MRERRYMKRLSGGGWAGKRQKELTIQEKHAIMLSNIASYDEEEYARNRQKRGLPTGCKAAREGCAAEGRF